MKKLQFEEKQASVGADGEFSGAVFCTDCGSLNQPDIENCKSCHAVLAEQGNHLSARLRRISRRASNVQSGRPDGSDDDWVGETDRAIPERSNPTLDPFGVLLANIAFVFLSIGFPRSSSRPLKPAIQNQQAEDVNITNSKSLSDILYGIAFVAFGGYGVLPALVCFGLYLLFVLLLVKLLGSN